MKHKQLTLAVLISTSNHRLSLFDCLRHIKKQTCLPNHIIIIETTSKQGVINKKKLVNMFPKNIHITYKKISSGYVSVSRNIALKYVREEIILYIDDDVQVDKSYIKDLLKIYENEPAINSVVGRIFPKKREYWQIFINHLISAGLTRPPDKPHIVEHWPALNFSIRRKCLQSTKLKFNENYSAIEDMDLCLRLKKAGFTINYFPHLHVKHKYEKTMFGFINKFRKYFRNVPLFNRDHADRKMFNIEIFSISISFKPLYYAKLIKRMLIQSNLLRKQLRLPWQYYFACLAYNYALFKGITDANSCKIPKGEILLK